MKFEDTLWVQKRSELEESVDYNADGRPVEPHNTLRYFGRCFLSFNSAAQRVALDDGNEYQYSHYIIAPLKKDLYPLIPREGERVLVRKADDTVFSAMTVSGFVTYKKRYLKIWGRTLDPVPQEYINEATALNEYGEEVPLAVICNGGCFH